MAPARPSVAALVLRTTASLYLPRRRIPGVKLTKKKVGEQGGRPTTLFAQTGRMVRKVQMWVPLHLIKVEG